MCFKFASLFIEGSHKMDKTMEQMLFKAKVTATNADETVS